MMYGCSAGTALRRRLQQLFSRFLLYLCNAGQCAEPVQANSESSCVAADSTLDLRLSRVAQPVARLLDRWIRAQHADTTPVGGTPLGNWPPIPITASLPLRKPDVAIFFDIFPNSFVTS
jgi:hypothetical protein